MNARPSGPIAFIAFPLKGGMRCDAMRGRVRRGQALGSILRCSSPPDPLPRPTDPVTQGHTRSRVTLRVTAVRAIRLAAKPDGGVRVLERREDVPPDQLERLRAHKAELAEIVEAFGPVEVVRARTWVPPRAAVVPFVPPRAARPAPPVRPSLRRPPKPHPPPTNPCVRCGRPCPPADLAESVPLEGGRWQHLSCWLEEAHP
jgi:hypothetical protein